MEINDIKPGMRIKTTFELKSFSEIGVQSVHLHARKANAVGTVLDWIPGQAQVKGVWWVSHGDTSRPENVAAYSHNEFNAV